MHPAIVQTPVEACRPRLQVDYRVLDAEAKLQAAVTAELHFLFRLIKRKPPSLIF